MQENHQKRVLNQVSKHTKNLNKPGFKQGKEPSSDTTCRSLYGGWRTYTLFYKPTSECGIQASKQTGIKQVWTQAHTDSPINTTCINANEGFGYKHNVYKPNL